MTETLYKLTDKDGKSYGDCQWGENVTHTADGKGELCTEHYLHAYTHPLLAVLLNPIHGSFDLMSALLWECEGEVARTDYGLKVGCTTLTTRRRIALPHVTIEARIAFGVECALAVYPNRAFVEWAEEWLNGTNRSPAAAEAAEVSAWAAKAAWAAEVSAAKAAAAAVEAAAGVAKAAWAAEVSAAEAAAWAAKEAAGVEAAFDLANIAAAAIAKADKAEGGTG